MTSKTINLKETQGKSNFSINLKLKCEITSFSYFSKDNNNEILFNLTLNSSITNKEWSIKRTYLDFNDYISILKQNFFEIPSIPKVSFSKIVTSNEINIKKDQLNSLIILILKRTDVMSSMSSFHFFELKNHHPDFHLFQPYLYYDLSDLAFESTGLSYSNEGSLVFCGLGKRSNTQVSKLMNKVSNFLTSYVNVSVKQLDSSRGMLIIYNLINNKSGETMLHPLYEKSFFSEVSFLKFHEETNYLILGFDSGEIKIFKIYITESSEVTKDLIDEVVSVKAHSNRVLSVGIDFNTGYLFSISNDTKLNISEFNYQTKLKTIKVSKESLTCLIYNLPHQLLVISDCKGSIFFYNTANPLEPIKVQSIYGSFSSISYIEMSENNKILYLGTNKGELLVFKVTVSREGMSMDQQLTINTDEDLRIIKVNESKSYFLIGLSNGSISIHKKTDGEFPLFVLCYHQKSIGSFIYLENKHLVISSSYDKSIKVYQLPILFPCELMLGQDFTEDDYLKGKDNKEINEIQTEKTEDEERITMNIPKSMERLNSKLESKLYSKENHQLSTEEMLCEDVDGWDEYIDESDDNGDEYLIDSFL